MRIGETTKNNYKMYVQIPIKDTASATQGKEHSGQAPQKAQSQITANDIDEVTISNEAKAKAQSKEEQKFADALERMRAEGRELQRQLEIARKQGEGVAEYYRSKLKCLIIAMRIMQGDIVPPEDHRFLLEEDPELYKEAMTMRIEKEDPKEHDRVSEDKKKDSNSPDKGETAPIQTENGETTPMIEAGGDSVSDADVE
ncbi:MAG: hypothetical protein FWH57_11490 [Oscillospiraceae bacterium]|nr:hypothetical protein [Oscillospiraceae bacterium]